MSIQFKTNFDLKKQAQEIKQRVRAELQKATLDAAREIKERTAKGIDSDGSTFKAYSKGYALKRKKTGRNTGIVDLLYTGKMLGAITTRVETSGPGALGTITFASAAEAVKARFNMATRNFFALSDSQIKRIAERIKRAINGR